MPRPNHYMLLHREAGLLPKKRPPKGEEVMLPLELGVWYRVPFYKKGHLPAPSLDTALCGHPLVFDEVWYTESGWEEFFGFPFYLQVDERKGEKCGPCKTKWKKEEVAIRVMAEQIAALRPESPFEDDLAGEAAQVGAELTRQTRRIGEWFALQVGGEVVT